MVEESRSLPETRTSDLASPFQATAFHCRVSHLAKRKRLAAFKFARRFALRKGRKPGAAVAKCVSGACLDLAFVR